MKPETRKEHKITVSETKGRNYTGVFIVLLEHLRIIRNTSCVFYKRLYENGHMF